MAVPVQKSVIIKVIEEIEAKSKELYKHLFECSSGKSAIIVLLQS